MISNTTFKLGRNKPVGLESRQVLKADNYLLSTLPKPPEWTNYTYKAQKSLSDVYLNDQLGDCVIAMGYHYLGLITGNAGKEIHVPSKDIIYDYRKIGGYIPGRPETDQGCDEHTALDYWTKTGFSNGTKLSGWMTVDAKNKNLLQLCLYLFENLAFGVSMPDRWVGADMPQANHFVWGVAGQPNPNNGHAFLGVGYNKNYVLVDTWGLLGYVTYDAIAEYLVNQAGGELYVLLTQDAIDKARGKAPNELDWQALVKDFEIMGGGLTPTS